MYRHLDSYKQYEPTYHNNHTGLLYDFCESSVTDWAWIFYIFFIYMIPPLWKSVAIKINQLSKCQYVKNAQKKNTYTQKQSEKYMNQKHKTFM